MRGALLALRSGAVVAVLAVVLSLLVDGAPRAVEASTTPPASQEQPPAKQDAKETRKPAQVPRGVVTIAAVGDIVMGSTPNLPPAAGRTFFDDVETDLAADVVLGNLEGTLTNATGPRKCAPASTELLRLQDAAGLRAAPPGRGLHRPQPGQQPRP